MYSDRVGLERAVEWFRHRDTKLHSGLVLTVKLVENPAGIILLYNPRKALVSLDHDEPSLL